ncbi:MAG: SIS domain-containing protein [Pseudonocardia sp.]
MIDEDITTFTALYLSRLATVIEQANSNALSRSCRLLRETIVAGRRLCAVGNGGSSAIARSASFQIRCQTHVNGYPTDVLDVGDQHEIEYWAWHGSYVSAFADVLAQRRVNAGDAAIVISMSGASTNLLALARSCREQGVEVLAFTGGTGGELAALASQCVSTAVGDQQISEDAVLALLTLVIDCAVADRCRPAELAAGARLAANRIRTAAATVDLPEFLRGLSTAVATAMLSGRAVFVVCEEGGPLGWAVEHIAHNLYWDVPTSGAVRTPVVVGTPSVADLTAIHNDHPDQAHGLRYRLGGLAPGDVVCGIASDTGVSRMNELLASPTCRDVTAHLITSSLHTTTRPGTVSALAVEASDVWALSTVIQPFGHLLCRLTAQRLRDSARDHAGSSLDELVMTDLAPGRGRAAAVSS